jgi:hypothetical protein
MKATDLKSLASLFIHLNSMLPLEKPIKSNYRINKNYLF